MQIQFLGHACTYVKGHNIKALIDPFMSDNPTCSKSPQDFNDLTHIFLTHGHSDHLGDTIQIAKDTNALVITNYELATILSKEGIRVHPMHIGGRIELDGMIIKMTPALHGSSIETSDGILYGGNPCGFVIEIEGKKLYHAGDTGLTMDMKLLKIENIDVAMLPIGGNFTMDIQDATRAVDFICPKVVIPIHYNTFPVIKQDPQIFKDHVHNAEVILLQPNELYEW